MKTGMLWLDQDEKRDLETKVANAATHYQRKYGQYPQMCFVHPSALLEPALKAGIEVRPSKTILPGHLWIGLREN